MLEHPNIVSDATADYLERLLLSSQPNLQAVLQRIKDDIRAPVGYDDAQATRWQDTAGSGQPQESNHPPICEPSDIFPDDMFWSTITGFGADLEFESILAAISAGDNIGIASDA